MPAFELPADAEPIFKDGKPGWIVGYETTISDGDFADIVLEDGTATFVRLPDYGGRITRSPEQQAIRIAKDYDFNTAAIRAAHHRWAHGGWSHMEFAPLRARQLHAALDAAIAHHNPAIAEAAE